MRKRHKKLLLFVARFNDVNVQLKTCRSQMDASRQDFVDYKEKASRILMVGIHIYNYIYYDLLGDFIQL